MDERQAQFFISVGTLLGEAHLAGLRVELELAGGGCISGVPARPPAGEDQAGLDDTGFADEVLIAGGVVLMSDLVAVRLPRPDAPAAEELPPLPTST